jgi:hypothetical protein
MSRSLIQEFMPSYKMRQIDRVRVSAPPEAAWRVVRALDTQAHPLSRALFALRTLPDKLLGRSSATPGPNTARIEDFTGPGKGFQILAEQPGREIVIGSVGKFWKLKIEWADVQPWSFTEFSAPGFGKLAWNLRVDPDSRGGSWISWDLRVTTTDEVTWKLFRKYWLVIGRFSHLLRRSALRSFQRQLAGPGTEESLKLACDDLVPSPRYQKTMAITIEAPPHEVWPWLVQMGCRRGGWYSIDALDNGGAPSALQIRPELQSIHVGQVLPWKPTGDEGFSVLHIERERTLVLGTAALLNGPHREDDAFNDTWAFILEPIGAEATRLITRVRADYRPGTGMRVMSAWLRPAHRIMEHAQLVNLKRRIEAKEKGSSILAREAPQAQFRSRVEVEVNAPAAQVLQAFDQVTPGDMPVAWLLGGIRYLPGKLLGRKPPLVGRDEPFGKKLMESGSLEVARAPEEIVIASAGKYHRLTDQELVRFRSVGEFRSFNHPAYQKLLISVRAEPLDHGRSRLILEHWTWALSEGSRRKFARYWKVIRPMGNFVSRILLKAAGRRAEAEAAPRPGLGAPRKGAA